MSTKLILIFLGLGALGALIAVIYSRDKTEDKNAAPRESDDVKYQNKVREIEEKEYPKFLSYKLFIKSKIRKVPDDIVKKLEETYGLRESKPIIDFGDVEYNMKFWKALKKRMEREPEILKILPSTGSIPLDYEIFLRKKAEFEAMRIIDEITGSKSPNTGGNDERN